jgi:GDP-4-dehydro-6-deoxy-D-mannose reductase
MKYSDKNFNQTDINVLVTGASGMVGSHLIDLLIEKTNWNIFALIRWRSSLDNLENALKIDLSKRLRFCYGDIRDSHAIDGVIKEVKPNYTFHLAAQSFPKTSFNSPDDTLKTNINGTLNILESLRNHSEDCITHVCSSSEVFGRVAKEKLPINEECSFHPASPYAISKVGTDLLGRFYAEAYGMNIQVTRMFTHTGPRRGDVFAESSFAKQIAMAEAGLIPPVIKVGNLDSLRTIADVRDAVNAYHMLLTINPIAGNYFNIGGNKVISIGEILEYLKSKSLINNLTHEVDESRLRPIDADLQIPSTNKFKTHTGWEPLISYEVTLMDLLNYWRDQVKKNRTLVNR